MPDSKIQNIEDRIAIRDTLYNYARGADSRDWDLFRCCFLEEVEIDLSSWNGAPASAWPLEEWVATVRRGLSGFDATQHLTANHLIEAEGDQARCTSDVQASHRLGKQRVVLGGWYDTQLRRTSSGWKIGSNTLHVTWREGPETLFAEAAQRLEPETSE